MSEAVRDLGALRALREVGRRGSIAAAATVLGVSQQALSARMRTLERTMNLTLLVRSPGGSHLTEQGRLIVGWAEDILDAADRLEAGLRSIRSGVSHRLAIAASQTDHLAAQHPPLSARIAMELGTSAAVRSAIAEGVGPGVLSRLAVRDDLVLGRLVAIEVAGPPLIRQLTAVWRPDLDPLPPEA